MLHELETITPYDYHLIAPAWDTQRSRLSRFPRMLHIGPLERHSVPAEQAQPDVDDLRRHAEFSDCTTWPNGCSILMNASPVPLSI